MMIEFIDQQYVEQFLIKFFYKLYTRKTTSGNNYFFSVHLSDLLAKTKVG